MRRLLGAGRPARGCCGRRSAGRFWRHPLDRAERLPRAGARARRPGGRHRRRPRPAGRPAPGAARDGRAGRVAVRLLHAGLHLQHGRRVLPAGPRCHRPTVDPSTNGHTAADGEHGPNGFDLHALSGNLCRCTGYRPIRDAAYALGAPAQDDDFAARCSGAAPAVVPTRVRSGDAEFVRPADLGAALALLADRPDATVIAGCTDWGVEVNLRGTRAPFVVAVDRLPELRTFSVGSTQHRDRGGADPVRGRAAARRPGAAAGPAVAAVRVSADPQRRHARREPRHRLPHRRRPARAAGAGGVGGAGRARAATARCR